jgi:tetratricopeptide (TPR) repeat protein
MKQCSAIPERRRANHTAFFFLAAAVASGFGQAAAPAARRSSGQSEAAARPRVVDQRILFWQQQVAKDPEYWGSLNGLAAAYAQKARETGDISYFELAEATLQQSLKAESAHAEAAPAYTQLATVHLAEHRFQEAVDDAVKAIAFDPEELGPYPYAGDAELELGNYKESQGYYEHLTAPNDGRPHPGIEFLAYSHGAGLDWIEGDTSRASDDMQHAIVLAQALHMPAENIAWTQFMAGEQFFMMGDLVAAEKAESESLQSFPKYHRALAAMGQIRAAQGKYADAIDYYRQAIAIIPLPLYVASLGDLYTVSGDKANAQKQYALVEFIGKLSAINKQVYNRELALFYADHDRRLPEALTLAEKELEVRHDVFTSDALAWALLKNHQSERARVEIEKAMRMGTKDALLDYHAGMIYAALGDRTQAAAHLKRALEINPHFHVIFAQEAARTLAGLDRLKSPEAVAGVGGSDGERK